MGLTVEQISKQFGERLSENDMIRLVGSSNFGPKTVISDENAAKYSGPYASDIITIFSKTDKEKFTQYLADDKRTEINAKLRIQDSKQQQNQNNALPSNIPMDVSIFDVGKRQLV